MASRSSFLRGNLAVAGLMIVALPVSPADSVPLTTAEDHKRMLDLLGISALRRGADGRNPNAPNAANYDESKANPYPELPDPLRLKNGRKATTAAAWWKQRRPEIVEEFDSEIYGRVPDKLPSVRWEVTETIREMIGDGPVVKKKLIGHVDNAAYPRVQVDIALTLVTPADAKRPVPVLLS